jgi:choline dehydrogenase-like flavoprotein
MINKSYDAIVVGSGITGGWAAKELTEKGLNVLLLDRSPDVKHGIDYKGEHVPSWKLPFYGKDERQLNNRDYFISQHSGVMDASNRHLFNNDRQNPYQYDTTKPFQWIRGGGVGGRSLLWYRQCYRFSEADFKANSDDGHGSGWPIGYQDLAPWYDYVEDFIGISGQAEGLDQLPDGKFLPPMKMYGIEKTVKQRIEKKIPEITMTIGRTAVLTENHRGRAACHYCGPCERGCSTGSYFSTQSSTLPAAKATNKLTLRPDSVVERLEYDPETKRVSIIHVIDAKSGERLQFSSDIVFLCASTIASTQILLNSSSEHFPNGMANSSGVLGKYLMDHTTGIIGSAVFLDNLDNYYYGNRPNGFYIPRFRNNQKQDKDAEFIRGYGFQGNSTRPHWADLANQKGFGKAYKDALTKPGNYWAIGLAGFGECLPHADNRVSLDSSKPDRFGIPQVRVDMEFRDNELKARADMAVQAEKIFRAAGAVFYTTNSETNPPGAGIHEMGTARMGDNPEESVLNKWNQTHDIANLFVTDGSCMVSSSCVNPSLTYMALTARACDYAVSQLKKGAI